MKPRLKLLLSGSVVLLAPGDGSVSERQARRLINEHWGSVEHFADGLGVSYWAACQALQYTSRRCAGKIQEIRLMLGLPSEPSAHAVHCTGARS